MRTEVRHPITSMCYRFATASEVLEPKESSLPLPSDLSACRNEANKAKHKVNFCHYTTNTLHGTGIVSLTRTIKDSTNKR